MYNHTYFLTESVNIHNYTCLMIAHYYSNPTYWNAFTVYVLAFTSDGMSYGNLIRLDFIGGFNGYIRREMRGWDEPGVVPYSYW